MYTQLEQRGMTEPPVNVATLQKMRADGEAIACLTAYDASFSMLVDAAGTDLVLVGDSLGMVIQGHDTTVPVTVADIIYHTKNVARGLRRAFLVADMPFMSYADPGQALENSVLLMQEGGAMMIKLEGGDGQLEIVEHLLVDRVESLGPVEGDQADCAAALVLDRFEALRVIHVVSRPI